MDKVFEIVAAPGTGRTLVVLALLFPFLAAFLVWLCGQRSRRTALLLALVHLGITVCLAWLGAVNLTAAEETATRTSNDLVRFQPNFVPRDNHRVTLLSLSPDLPTATRAAPSVQLYLGIDGINLWLVALTSFMLIPTILISWESVTERRGAFFAWLFVLQGASIGAFLSFDVILFYVFFELTLIPAFFLIGNWGVGSARRDAARKFFLYTLAGSLLTLVGVVGVVVTNPDPVTGQITFSLPDLMANVQHWLNAAHADALAGNPEKLAALHATQFWLFLAMMAGFMVKVPIWPFHTWLPSAYGEAPIGGTVMLAAVLSKLGTFGILRFVLALVPDAALVYGLPVVGSLAAFGIVYTALCAFAQRDIKQMFAYSSISHLGFLVLGIFAFNTEGVSGAVLHMVNHGLSTGALFAMLAFLIDRYRTTQISSYGGLMARFPIFSLLMFILCLASVGLPGLNNFVSEMLMLGGLFNANNPKSTGMALAVIAAFSIFLGSWYIMTMLQRVFFNEAKLPPALEPEAVTPTDVNRRELLAFGSLAVLCLVLGLYPQPVLSSIEPDAKRLSLIGDAARARVKGEPLPKVEPLPVPTTNPTPIPPKKRGKKDKE